MSRYKMIEIGEGLRLVMTTRDYNKLVDTSSNIKKSERLFTNQITLRVDKGFLGINTNKPTLGNKPEYSMKGYYISAVIKANAIEFKITSKTSGITISHEEKI